MRKLIAVALSLGLLAAPSLAVAQSSHHRARADTTVSYPYICTTDSTPSGPNDWCVLNPPRSTPPRPWATTCGPDNRGGLTCADDYAGATELFSCTYLTNLTAPGITYGCIKIV